jgi:antirestriction protein ArdC
MRITDLYASVTQSIVRELEAGAAPWLRPWRNGRTSGLMPQNYVTGRPYSGINIMLLWAARDAGGYAENGWMTFKQALERGACVRKGEKATAVVFTKKLTVKDKEKEDEEKRINMLRTYSVFNQAQIDGLSEEKPEPPAPILPPIEAAARFIAATKADIRIGGNKACYVPSLDFVAMPAPQLFKSHEGYYATNLHELGHWAGAAKRLNRDLTGRFGTRKYAAEELVAELTAAFLCARLGIEGQLRHAGYIESWVELLKHDDRAIFSAASKASQAADYLRSFSETVNDEAPP